MDEEEKINNEEKLTQEDKTEAQTTPDDSQAEMMKMLGDLKASVDQQVKYAKKQSRHSLITSIACFVMMLAVCAAILFVMPTVNRIFGDVNIILNDMKVVTTELAEADLDTMFGGIQDLIVEGSEGMTEAIEKLDEIDIEGLNRAIKNLSDAVQPFAAFFGRGR